MTVPELKLLQVGECIEPIRTWNPAQDSEDKTFRYIDISSVSQGEKRIIPNGETPTAEAPSRARQLVQTGDVLVSTVRPNLNAVAFVPEEMDGATASTGFCVLRPKPNRLDGRYLFHWVRTSSFVVDMTKKATGQSYPAVSDKIVKNSLLPLLPLDEQKRIAAILDQADELRRLRQHAIDQLNELGPAIFQEMFGDRVSAGGPYQAVTLESVAELINGDRSSNYPSGDDLVEAGVLFLSTKNVQNGEIDLTTCQFITPEKFRSLTRGKLQRHDIVITLRGTLGQCAEFDCDFETGFINAQMMIIRARDQLRPLYLRSFLSHPRTQALLQQDSSGSAVPQLTGKQIGELFIPIPPIEIQDEFSLRVEKIQKVALQSLLHNARLARLFSSLQHRAFQGEL